MSLGKGLSYGASGATIGTAIAPGIGTAIGGGLGLLGGLFSDDENDGSQAAIEAAVAAINAVQIPEVDKAILIKAYKQNGKLTPELVQKLPLNADVKQTLVEAPKNKQNQDFTMNALKQMSQSGMTAQDLAQMQQMRSSVAEDTNAKTQQLLQQSQMRGQLGGGDTLAAQLMANQQGSQQASRGALDAAASAAQARKEALSQYGSMANTVRGQDYETQQANMQNELARQRFLDENSTSRQSANVGAQNQANVMNLQRQQQVGDANIGAQNQELQRQVEAKKWMADMQLRKAMGVANARTGQAQMLQQAGQNAAQAEGNLVGGITNLAISGNKAGLWGKQPVKAAHGGRIPGDAHYPGDTQMNDIIDAKLSPGEIVVPRTKAEDPEDAKDFVDQLFKKEKKVKAFDKNEALLNLIAELHDKKSKE